MNQRYKLIWRILLVVWMVCGAYVSASGAQDIPYEEQARREWEEKYQKETFKLIVMIQGQLGEGPTIGAGIIFGLGKDQVYIATANHVVRRGTLKARDLQVKLRDLPNEFLPATLLDDAREDMDLAVVHVQGLSRHGIDGCALPIDRLGKVSALKRGDAVYPSGYPNGVPWGMPVAPDSFVQIVGREITFQSSFISQGHSGGGLLNKNYNLVGVITKDAPPFGLAIQLESILKVVQQWGYPVHLYRRQYGMPALHQAAEDGDFDAVKRLLKYECTDVNETDLSPWRYTPLDYATQNGRIEVMKLLLQAGADPNKGLICAAQSGQIEAIKLLISLGAKVNGDQGSSPLYEAMSHKKWEAAKLLLAAGADIAKLKPNPSYLFDALASNELGILKLLIEYGVDINAVGSYSDKTLLSEAVKNNNLDAVKLLLEHGADVNIKYYGGETALRMAIWGNNVTVVKLLLEHGADINEKDSDGGTMLHKAIYEENVGVVKLLIDSKADVNAQSPKKDAPLNLAAENQGKYKYHEIENNKRMLEILELLLKAGANVNIQRYYDGETPLHIVTRLAYCTEPVATNAALKLLISYGANLKIGDRNGDTPLHDAVYTLRLGGKPMFEVIQILVQAGAPLGARNKYNKTPVDLMRDDKVPETEIIKLMESQGGKK